MVTAGRLRAILRTRYAGENVIVLANRPPFTCERDAQGEVTVRRSPGGVVTALEPVVQACEGAWVASGRSAVPSRGYRLRGVAIDEVERRGHYDGFSNEGLWPLCHRAGVRPVFRRDDFDNYRIVNERFAAAVCEEVDSPSPLVLVQDYHFALAPESIRARLPHGTIVSFWHIPWPEPRRFEQCRWANRLLHGLLGSTIVGFQTPQDCANFIETVATCLRTPVDRAQRTVIVHGRRVAVRDYPISIEWPASASRQAPAIDTCRRDVRRQLRVPPGTLLVVGVDRLDYTKGIEEKFLAFERLLDRHPGLRGRVVCVQLAEPSRVCLPAYRDLRRRVTDAAARINARFGMPGVDPIVLIERHHEQGEVFRFLRAADVCYVGSLHDGMNLVSKEFVAARDDSRGVLVLSRFTGAARELSGALLVDPRQIDDAARTLAEALQMPADDQARRMQSMRATVGHCNVYKWACDMLADAAALRERELRQAS